jgi:hypothetical protein
MGNRTGGQTDMASLTLCLHSIHWVQITRIKYGILEKQREHKNNHCLRAAWSCWRRRAVHVPRGLLLILSCRVGRHRPARRRWQTERRPSVFMLRGWDASLEASPIKKSSVSERGSHYLVMATQPLHLLWKKCPFLFAEDRVMATQPLHLLWRKCPFLFFQTTESWRYNRNIWCGGNSAT